MEGGAVTKAGEALRHHHRQLAHEVARQAALTGRGAADPEPFISFLRDALLPHAAGEDRFLYPAVEPLLKAHGMATATMRLDHRAIERYVHALEGMAARLKTSRKADRDRAHRELARLVWQLQALFEVHLEKEEQVYLPLLEQYVPEVEQQRILDQMHEAPPESVDVTEATLDVRPVPAARRHPLILDTFEALRSGQAFTLVNDHDPKPLFYQFQAEHPGKFTWTYLERGPEVWRVRIGRA
jgi:uncharacterized protein (DUF2249 family)/hemerythrin-like domain-containing protein